MKFFKNLWEEVTGKMLPWFKWSFGVVVYIIALVVIPFCFIAFIPFLLLDFLLSKIKIKINVKKYFFKEEKDEETD